MQLKRIHIRYAQAFYQIAKKKKVLTQVVKDVQNLLAVYENVPAFQHFLQNPLYKPAKKIKTLTEALTSHLHPTTLIFISFLLTKRREDHLSGILHQFEVLRKVEQHIKTAYITTVRTISPALRKTIIQHIQHITTDEEVDLIEKTDSDLIGGYILKIGDQQLDMSIRTQLIRLQSHWEKSPLPDLNHPAA
jgi:F-type H+-transporting ATPase subunit delta